MLVTTPPPHTFWLPPQAASALKQKQMYVVLEGRNSIRQHTKKGPEKDRQRGKGERPAETKATRDGTKKKEEEEDEEEAVEGKRNREEPRVRK